MKHSIKLLMLAGLFTAAALAAHAQPNYIAGSGVTPSWTPGDAGLQLIGSPLSLSTATPANAYHEFKVTGATWGDPNYPANNVKIKGNANGTNTFHFYPGTTVDGWVPLNNRIGYDDPGNMTFEIIGSFTGWSTGTNLNAIGNGVYSNSIVVATAGNYEYKFRAQGTWSEFAFGSDMGHNGANGAFTTTTSPQTVPVQLDLPNGRWVIGSLVPPPVTNNVIFAVDMSSQIQLGKFHPGYSVFTAGAFNSWPGPGGGLVLTNDPPYLGGSNTNIYYGTNIFVGSPSSFASEYKFNNNDPAADNGGWEQSANKSLTLLATNGTLRLPVAIYNNTVSSDYLTANTTVTFTVNMTNAVAGVSPFTVWDHDSMVVRLTGNFDDNGWAPSPWSPPNLRTMTETPPGSHIYTYTHTVLAGHPVDIHYKYSFDDNVNALDNEAPAYQDHVRVIRTPASGSYTLPMDTFGNQHVEPAFSQLTATAAGGGNVSVQWLGRPGVKLQSNSSLNGGAWTDHNATDGTTWTGTTVSTSEGTATVTNLPAGGSAGFFRTVKPN